MTTPMTMTTTKALATAAVLLAAATTGVRSEPVQWVGLGSNNLWDDPANWNPIKIPQPADDVSFPPNSNALIGTSNGATANSVTVADNSTLKVLGSNATFGSGGVQINGNSLLYIDSGAYPFTSVGTLRIGGTSRVDWYSGSLVADVQVGSGAAFVVEGAGSHYLTKDVKLSRDSTLVVQGPVLAGFWGVVTNDGGLVHVNGSAGAHLTKINITNTNGGRFVIDGVSKGQMQVDTIQADSLTLATAIYVQNQARLSNVMCNNCPGASFGGITYLTSWSGGGQVTVGAAGSLYLSGKNRFTGLDSYGKLECQTGDITTGALHVSKVFSVGSQCPVQADVASFGNDVFASGDGTVSVGQSQWFGTVRIGQGLTYRAEKSLALNGVNSVLLDGLLDLAPGAVLNATSTNAVVAVSILAKPGRLNNNGTVVVTGVPRPSRLVLTWAAYTGQGQVALVGNATLDVQNTAVAPTNLAFNGVVTKVTGEGCSFGWGALTGPAPGAKLSIILDGRFEQCASPCAGRAARPYQNLEVLPAQ